MNPARPTVLIVDDSAADRLAFRHYLHGHYTVLEAAGGEEGLRAWRESRPDCLLLDYCMPDLDGLDVLERIRQEAGPLCCAVVMLTGTTETEVAVRALRAGAHDYLDKSTATPAGLVQAVAHAIDKLELLRTLERERVRSAVILDSIGDAVIATDGAGRVTFLNPAAEFLTGRPAAAAVGVPLAEIVRMAAPEPPGAEGAGFGDYRLAGTGDGPGLAIEGKATPLGTGGQADGGTVLVLRDVTERRRMEAELWASEERLRRTLRAAAEERGSTLNAVFEHVPVGIVLAEVPDGRINTLSRHARDLLGEAPDGRPAEEWLSDGPVFEADGVTPLHPENLPRARALRGEIVRNTEVVHTAPDGRRLRLLKNAGPVYDATGNLVAAVEAWRDIGAEREAEAALRASERRFRMIFEHAATGIVFAEGTGRIVDCNPAFSSLLGYTADELRGKMMTDFVHPEDFEVSGTEITRLRTGAVPFCEIEGRCLRKDGTPVWARKFISLLAGESGVPDHLLVLVTDVTEQRRGEDTLREADRRKDEFLAVLAHELRNPLAPLRTGLRVLAKTTSAEPATDRVFEMMERQVVHLVRLVDDLLEISRISRGKLDLKKDRVDLGRIVAQAVETCQSCMAAGGHELSVSLPERPVLLYADPVRLTQIFTNLLNNAAKYTPAGGRIWLAARQEGREAVVSVHDTGVGIPAEMLPRVFDLFTQVESPLDHARGGLGIGLALVQKLVALHGGRVEARSEGPGRGSEFIVRLPVANEAAPAAKDNSAPPAVLSAGTRILLVDDNTDAADSLGLLLESSGDEVRVVYDGPAALTAFAEFEPAVVILDLGMPGMTGYEVARRLRGEPGGRNATLIALTGWGQAADRRRSREAGFDYHLVKPVDFDALQQLLASLPKLREAGSP